MYYVACLMVSIIDTLAILPIVLTFLLVGASMYANEYKRTLKEAKTNRGGDG